MRADSLSLSLSLTHAFSLISRAWMQILSLIHKDTRARIFTHITSHTHTHTHTCCRVHVRGCGCVCVCVCVCAGVANTEPPASFLIAFFFRFFFGQEEGRHKNCLHPGVWLTISYKFKLTLKCYLSIS